MPVCNTFWSHCEPEATWLVEVCGCCSVLLLFLLIHGLHKFNIHLSSYQMEQKIFELQLIVFTPFERLYLFFYAFPIFLKNHWSSPV